MRLAVQAEVGTDDDGVDAVKHLKHVLAVAFVAVFAVALLIAVSLPHRVDIVADVVVATATQAVDNHETLVQVQPVSAGYVGVFGIKATAGAVAGLRSYAAK